MHNHIRMEWLGKRAFCNLQRGLSLSFHSRFFVVLGARERERREKEIRSAKIDSPSIERGVCGDGWGLKNGEATLTKVYDGCMQLCVIRVTSISAGCSR